MAASFLWGSALSFGRFDQELYLLYKKSRDEGMTQDEALELLCCLWLKINEPCLRTVQSLTVGGVTPEGAGCGQRADVSVPQGYGADEAAVSERRRAAAPQKPAGISGRGPGLRVRGRGPAR